MFGITFLKNFRQVSHIKQMKMMFRNNFFASLTLSSWIFWLGSVQDKSAHDSRLILLFPLPPLALEGVRIHALAHVSIYPLHASQPFAIHSRPVCTFFILRSIGSSSFASFVFSFVDYIDLVKESVGKIAF
jgi:hypothetical protein